MIACNLRQRVVLGASLLGMASLPGCGDLAHTNPLDRETTVAVEVTGPDSAFSYRDTVHFVAHTLPSYAPERIEWSSAGKVVLVPIGNGSFYVNADQPVQAAPETLRVEVDGRVATHVLTFVHRATTLRAGECASQSPTLRMDALGQSNQLCLWARDAHGYPASEAPAVTVSDPSIVDVGSSFVDGEGTNRVTVRSLANGTSVVRFSIRGISDSVPVTVRQRIVAVRLNPPACPSRHELAVGDSVRVSPTSQATDPNGNIVADTARVRAAVATMSFGFGFTASPSVTVSPSGLVVGVQPGWATIVGRATTPEEGTVEGVCSFHVY